MQNHSNLSKGLHACFLLSSWAQWRFVTKSCTCRVPFHWYPCLSRSVWSCRQTRASRNHPTVTEGGRACPQYRLSTRKWRQYANYCGVGWCRIWARFLSIFGRNIEERSTVIVNESINEYLNAYLLKPISNCLI